MFKIYHQMVKLNMNGDLKNNAVDQSHRLEGKSQIIRSQQNTKQDSINSTRTNSKAFLGCVLCAVRRFMGGPLTTDVEELQEKFLCRTETSYSHLLTVLQF